jgi:hypothetical protein
MSKSHFVAFACILTLVGSAGAAQAATTYPCPAANLVNCVPTPTNIPPWKANGGMMTGNTFAPNNTCANVIDLPGGKKRLLCCYTKCGVYIQDVPATQCTKNPDGESFSCIP